MGRKGLIVALSICTVIVAGLIATIIVLASGTQGVGTNVSVLYVATDIEGEVSATYSRVNKNTKAVISTTDMVTSSGAKKVSFFASQPTTTSLLNPTESNIALTAEQDLIITYTFSGVAEYYASLEYVDKDQAEPNIEFEYALNDGEYSKELSMPIKVDADKSTTFSIKLHIANTARNANLNGSLNWTLTKDEPFVVEDYVNLNIVNNTGSKINNNTFSYQTRRVDGKKQFKIVGATPIIDSSSTTSYLNGSFDERVITATGKVSSIDDLTNSNNAEFYYFCTNSAVVGSTGYNDPGEVYYTSTADSTLESWYDLPSSSTNLYSCFMTPNYTTEEKYSGSDTQIIISNNVKNIPQKAFYYGTKITDVVIPQSVTSIESRAFYNCKALTSIIIPDGVTSIGSEAFYNCSALTSITISDSVTSIGSSAFDSCTGLTSIKIPDKVTRIGQYAFDSCSGLTSIIIPDSVTDIGKGVFRSCANLTSITIGSGVTSIGDNFFYECSALTSINIPDSVTSIGDKVFYGCKAVTSITIGSGLTSIKSNMFSDFLSLTRITVSANNPTYYSSDNCLIEKSSKTLIKGCNTSVIPNAVTSIGDSAFSKCSALASITIPDSVTSIGDSVFLGCKAVTSITIGSGLTSIKGNTFRGLFSLTRITVSANNSTYYSSNNCLIEKSSKTLIQGCNTSVIPNDVTSIGEYAFESCSGLTSIIIPDNVTSIGSHAFYNCSALTSITIGSGVTSIEGDAFSCCSKLTNVTFKDTTSTWTVNSNTISVTDPAQNATYFTNTYKYYAWTKNS